MLMKGLPGHQNSTYRQTPDLSMHIIVAYSSVVGASLVGAAPATSSFSTNTWLQWIGQRQLQAERKNI